MYIKNREEYCKIPISALNFSTRTYNCLMRAKINTLYLLIENIENLEKSATWDQRVLLKSMTICPRMFGKGLPPECPSSVIWGLWWII
ncbi:MAG: hypothetical protein HFH91_03285 [Lachnospiraceae bacterium]|nr:hypothetical protein [Lachnospiraceae bacterium]